ncbi:thiol-disulfide oxidoreductase DCC family protein [Streptomyces fodineus]|uniref:thiol-disulfide oxidoreductase DCC family protein n=1 Tax=Streptomyces fodineus TaxID=1904616 RepID=UPI001D0570E0|nr:DCC1-like thiol-disulfide oxidoreductase family protein [Streptomyces fodineus]
MRIDLSTAVSPDAPSLAFDGDCGFCQATITRLQRHARPRMRAMPWQALPDHITRPHRERLDREVLVFRGAHVADSGAQALGAYLASSPRFRYRATGLLLRAPVVRQAARLVYRQVATHRHRMPAGTAACALPRTHD